MANYLLKFIKTIPEQFYVISYLLKWGTTWNQLKPPRNYLKPHENTWIQPYYIIFLLDISYSQVVFLLILHPKALFDQILSQKLKFSKLTEILYKITLLYVYYDFFVYFFKLLFIQFFLAKFGPKIWNSSNWLKFECRGTLLYGYYNFSI